MGHSEVKGRLGQITHRLERALKDLLLSSFPANHFLAQMQLIGELSPLAIRSLIRPINGRIPTILDIGANDGSHSRIFAKVFNEKVKIHAFEPDPRAIQRFHEARNPSAISLHQIVLSEQTGVVRFFQSSGWPDGHSEPLPGGWDYSGSIRRPLNLEPWLRFDTEIEVASRTLDDWSATHAPDVIDFIWMDVQGAELDVILGGHETLKRTRFIYTEYSNVEQYEGQPHLDDLVSQLPGWRVVIVFLAMYCLKTPFSVLREKNSVLPARHAEG